MSATTLLMKDRAAGKRVLEVAGTILKQLRSRSRRKEATNGMGFGAKGAGAGEVSTGEELADDEGLLIGGDGEEEEKEKEADGNGFQAANSTGLSEVPAPRAFHEALDAQIRREGLVGALVALAYPDRIARRKDRASARASFLMADGRLARLPMIDDPLGSPAVQYLAIAELRGGGSGGSSSTDIGRNDNIALAAALSTTGIDRYLGFMVTRRRIVFWASASKAVAAREQRRLGALVLEDKAVPVTDEEALPAVLQGFKEMNGLASLGIPKDLEAWRQRVCWLNRFSSGASLPDLSDEGLVASCSKWLPQHLSGVRSKADLTNLDWRSILYDLVGGYARAQSLEGAGQAPSHLVMPTGSRIPVDYSRDMPTVSVRIQEVFGLAASPCVGGLPVLMELLSPAMRPIQTTSDLAGFWASSYALVRKDMAGRYPRHCWPEDPSKALPTTMTKKKMLLAQEAQEAAAGAVGGGSRSGSKGQGAQSGKKAKKAR